ncbi:hypothetical protein [Metabacillus rhizolycopersici]|uniref:Uncharacterized protein n=1 Tax=Metabacillus rhizolycopersici TaxID=2875709 RepID=A0ABS7UWQ9_9BACI|nr:hypothetical protein [Metabacillus rhizolycopersici]MBZ5752751.1 hypothetical protein [Metabacillus rhizolycopersici]
MNKEDIKENYRTFGNEFMEKSNEINQNNKGTTGLFVGTKENSEMLIMGYHDLAKQQLEGKFNDNTFVQVGNREISILDYHPMIEEREKDGQVIRDLYAYNIKYTSQTLNNVKDELIQNGFSNEKATEFVLNEFKKVGLLDSYKWSDLEKKVNQSIEKTMEKYGK